MEPAWCMLFQVRFSPSARTCDPMQRGGLFVMCCNTLARAVLCATLCFLPFSPWVCVDVFTLFLFCCSWAKRGVRARTEMNKKRMAELKAGPRRICFHYLFDCCMVGYGSWCWCQCHLTKWLWL